MGQFEGNIDGEANSTKEGAIVHTGQTPSGKDAADRERNRLTNPMGGPGTPARDHPNYP